MNIDLSVDDMRRCRELLLAAGGAKEGDQAIVEKLDRYLHNFSGTTEPKPATEAAKKWGG